MDELLEIIGKRGPDVSGIALASRYVGAIGACLGEEACAKNFFGIASPEQWAEAVKSSAKVLTYTNADMEAVGGIEKDGAGVKAWGDHHKEWAKKWEDQPLTTKACMDFTCIATSKSKDRDADVLEPAGALPDAKAVLLWQHLQLSPIGRVLEWGKAADDLVPARASIVDSQLGNDAALLVEFKALKISHGFLPLQFEPLKADKSRDKIDPRLGWHVLSYKILELSLVSVQSNEDAIITNWQHDKLHHPMVKAWAHDLRRKLPATSTGWNNPANQPVVNVHLEIGPPGGHKAAPAATKCGCGGNTPAATTEPAKATTDQNKCPDCQVKLDEKDRCPKCGKVTHPPKAVHKLNIKRITFGEAAPTSVKTDGQFNSGPGVPMPYLDGSWEDTQADLESSAAAWLKQYGVQTINSGGGYYGSGSLVLLGTFDDHAILCLRSYDNSTDKGIYTCYQGMWEAGANGPQWTSPPEPVDLAVTHEGPAMPDAAAVASLRQKALATIFKGVKISKKNLAKLTQAQTLVHSVRTSGELAHPTQAVAEKAHGLISEVVTDCQTPTNQPMEAAAHYGQKLLESLKAGQTMRPDEADYLAAVLSAQAERGRAAEEEKTLALLLAS